MKIQKCEVYQRHDNFIISGLPLRMVDIITESNDSPVANFVANFCATILHFTISRYDISVASRRPFYQSRSLCVG